MREITAATTQRNQVTIPAEVRRLLGLKPRDKVAFTIEDGGEVRLAAASFSLESAYGSVKPIGGPVDLDQATRDAKDAKAEQTARELAEA
ncbi:MAG: AbrB/MazE/SpoVT family DNA-binding domain-containing protein [Chloroflexi bacterium]|nr:AbrB/MazE/SpoVT family DNA-binding domain-containing protein [Chloroflexota bacterium]